MRDGFKAPIRYAVNTDQSDAEIERMRRNDRFRPLYQKYYWRVVRFYVRSFRLTQEDAEELAQDAFLRFYEAMDEYRGDAEWAFFETIARNVAYNRIRSQKTAKRNGRTIDIDDPDFAAHEPAAPAGPDYAEREEDALRVKQLRDAIAQLPSGGRECLQLWLDDFKYDEIAKFLGITLDAVKSRLRDAKKLLRARLGDDALPEDEQ
jgi:RNA polymerase sigma-70 factor (ECF subfamily)